LSKPTVDDYIQQGIYGKKEINPDEKRKFLGTFRERVIIALTKSQVRKKKVYSEVISAIKENPKAKLYLNGNMKYSYLSKYIKVATKHGNAYTMATNKEYDSDIGLVLAHGYAIDKKNIYIGEEKPIIPSTTKPKSYKKQKRKGPKALIKKIFGR
jgi:uncharacterized protein YueI